MALPPLWVSSSSPMLRYACNACRLANQITRGMIVDCAIELDVVLKLVRRLCLQQKGMTLAYLACRYSLQRAHVGSIHACRHACSYLCDLCNWVVTVKHGKQALLLQERPVTKEVVTYVQERRPIAKQVLLL